MSERHNADYVLRWRARIGLWLIKPYLVAQRTRIKGYIEAGHQPGGYHKDWWWGQFFATQGLWDDLHRGRLAARYDGKE